MERGIEENELNRGEETSRECPDCHSKRIWKDGIRNTNNGSVQRFICRKCGYRFSESTILSMELSNYGNRQVCATLVEAKNLETAAETKTVAGESLSNQDVKGKIVEYLWHLKKQGYADETVKTRVKLLRQMAKENVNLNDPEDVKKAIASHDHWCNGHKQIVVHAYNSYCEMLKIQWTPPYYEHVKSLPFVPLEKEIDALISGCSKKIATSLLCMKETGMRIGEVWKLLWTDLDEENNTLKCRAEKHGNPRQFKISTKLIAMLKALPKTNEYVFGNTNLSSHRYRFERQRRRLAVKLQNPRLLQIKFHTLRHYYATKLFDETKSLPLVQEKLGHRSIISTSLYTHLVEPDPENQNYFHATAKDDKEAGELIDSGFLYVCTTPQGIMMFRKRKSL